MLMDRQISELMERHPQDVRKATVLAVIFRRTTIVSHGYNRKVWHYNRAQNSQLFTVHAEASAITKAGIRAKYADILVLRFKKDGSLGISKPCPICQRKIKHAGIVRIRYVNNDGKIATMSVL